MAQQSEERPAFMTGVETAYPDVDLGKALNVLLRSRTGATGAREIEPSGTHPECGLSAGDLCKIRWLIAVNPATPPDVLDTLACDGEPAILERIAEHPRAHASTLARLAFGTSAAVRAAVAENANAPTATINMLMHDECPDVRYRLAESYHLPGPVIEEMCDDDNPYVAHRARKTLRRLQEHAVLAANFSRDRPRRSNGIIRGA